MSFCNENASPIRRLHARTRRNKYSDSATAASRSLRSGGAGFVIDRRRSAIELFSTQRRFSPATKRGVAFFRALGRSPAGTFLADAEVLFSQASTMQQSAHVISDATPYDSNAHGSSVSRIWRIVDGSETTRCLRVAAVGVSPWVEARDRGLCGIEIEALERYCRWRACAAEVALCAPGDVAPLLRGGRVDLVIGGLAQTALLAAMARLVTFSPRPLPLPLNRPQQGDNGPQQGDGHRRHVWAAARCCGAEVLHLRFFLRALRFHATR